MARLLITDPADADSIAIISDLTTKAGELVADRYDAEFDALYRRLEAFPERARRALSLAGSFELASFRRMSWFTATFPTTISSPSSTSLMAVVKSHAAC